MSVGGGRGENLFASDVLHEGTKAAAGANVDAWFVLACPCFLSGRFVTPDV